MEIQVEFTGIGKAIAGTSCVQLTVDPQANCIDIVRLLGKTYPGLIGLFIHPDGETLLSSNVFVLNAEHVVLPEQMDAPLHEGDRLLLLAVIVGGCCIN